MSNTWLNVRFGIYHLQILMFQDWIPSLIQPKRFRRWPIRWSRNAYQAEQRKTDPDWTWFALYELRWPW